jgi:16S rRNA (cytosine967-C5)-methyltransferase
VELVSKQAAILDTASRLVKPGGRLIYATCSLLPAENEQQVAGFLARNPAFTTVPLAEAWPLETTPPCTGDFMTLTPLRHDTDGFFGAVLQRRPADPKPDAGAGGAPEAGTERLEQAVP